MPGVDSTLYLSNGEITPFADGLPHFLDSSLAQDEAPNASLGHPQVYDAGPITGFETSKYCSGVDSIDTSSQTQWEQKIPTRTGNNTQEHDSSMVKANSGFKFKGASTPVVAPAENNTQRVDASDVKMEKVRATCEFCGKSFGHLGDANKHRRSHTGERPYTCTTCFRSFPHSSNLRRHERSHSSNPRPFQCTTCDRGFSRKDKLAQHVARRCCSSAPIR